jgi:hypothetical protein
MVEQATTAGRGFAGGGSTVLDTGAAAGRMEPPGERLYRTADLIGIFGVSHEQIRKWRKAGVLPEPARQVGTIKYWLRSQLAGMPGM